MAKAKGSLVPIRGSVEDWGPGKHQRNLERKETYAKRMQEQVAMGPPDFDRLLSMGASPMESVRVDQEKKSYRRSEEKDGPQIRQEGEENQSTDPDDDRPVSYSPGIESSFLIHVQVQFKSCR